MTLCQLLKGDLTGRSFVQAPPHWRRGTCLVNAHVVEHSLWRQPIEPLDLEFEVATLMDDDGGGDNAP